MLILFATPILRFRAGEIMANAIALLSCNTVVLAAQQRPQRRAKKLKKPNTKQNNKNSTSTSTSSSVGFGIEKKEPLWRCVQGCGACCKLDKGPDFATPEEIFDDPSNVELYRSLIGPDGWCINYEKSTRKCSIYPERPYFCRVEPAVFQSLYGINKKKFNKEACNCCRDTIKAIYGSRSKELDNFNCAICSSDSSC